MWRFKASKYKNAAPKIPKKEECINDLRVGSVQSQGRHIKASNAYIVFDAESGGGGNLGVLPLDVRGRVKDVPVIQAHSEMVTDFDFSPFNDYLLASGSQDCNVKLWRLPQQMSESMSNAEHTVCKEEKKIENILWNPAADSILAVTTNNLLKVYDVNSPQPTYNGSVHSDQFHSISWNLEGSLIATSAKDKKVKIVDPRANKTVQEAISHDNVKDSNVLWIGDKDMILTAGYDMMRTRELKLRDFRSFSQVLKTVSIDSSTGILMPLYDVDTGMLFVAGKGDTRIRFLEITEKDPYITDGTADSVEQIVGLCSVPKTSMDVMSGEVNRLLVLTSSSIIPLPYIVPRKSYREFHDDLFPDTASQTPGMTAQQWLSGQNTPVPKVSLDPSKRGNAPVPGVARVPVANSASPSPASATKTSSPAAMKTPASVPSDTKPRQPVLAVCPPKPKQPSPPKQREEPVSPKPQLPVSRPKVFTGVRQSKFRHLKGTALHKDLHIENVKNISKTIPGESDFFHANPERCAVPLAGSGGLIAVYELSKPGRLPETGIPVIQNGSAVMDFVWNPFNHRQLITACDDAKIRIWDLPENGLEETMTESTDYLAGHTEKIYFVRFHPLASDILVSASYDMTVRIWELSEKQEWITLNGHTDTIFCAAWSADGKKLATVCKDGKIRVYDPRNSTDPKLEGAGPEGSRGARAVWVCNDAFILVTGFDKTSTRQLILYSSTDLSKPLSKVDLNVAPSILIPYYDEDSATVFATGRGDSMLYAYEVSTEDPHLFPLSHYKTEGLHQAFSFLPKNCCDIKKVEFAKAWRLTQTSVEPISFTVPRVKTNYFQDDLFPDTRMTWQPTLTGAEWLSGVNRLPKLLSLRPKDMKLLSEAPVEAPKPKKFESYNPESFKTEEQKKEELLSAMTNKLELSDAPLPQDLTEGVDEDEWDDY